MGNVIGAGATLLGSVSSAVSQVYQASFMPNQARGNTNSGDLNYSSHKNKFTVIPLSIKPEVAQVIDDYFSMFGYAQKRIMIPPKHNRAQWTYVKTIGCQGSGSVPNDDAVAIDTIYNNGVRFWAVPANLGNYALTNGTL
jgi:hypothetical protein